MLDPWGIYIHVPWCRRRCTYCDFYFEVGRPSAGFSEQILSEFHERRPFWPQSPAQTLYFGGGTPSLLGNGELGAILEGLSPFVAPGAEMTLEANPEDLSQEKLTDLRALGVNRISLGVQSFEGDVLKRLGRKHTPEMAFAAVEQCSRLFDRVSVDLIVGVPGEKSAELPDTLRQLKEHGVGHLSAYLLTIESGTFLAKQIEKGRFEALSDDNQAEAYERLQKHMEDQGYCQYEVSSYAQLGQESRHNRNYWGKGSYLGLGPNAHSMRFLEGGAVERSKNKAQLSGFGEGRECEILSPFEAFLEAVSFGLRDLGLGVNVNVLARKHHVAVPDSLLSLLGRWEDRGWITMNEGLYTLTRVGIRFADAVAREILALQD